MPGRSAIRLGWLLTLCAPGWGCDRASRDERAAATAIAPLHGRAAGPIEVTATPLVVGGLRLDGSIRPRAQAGAITGEDVRRRSAFALTAPGVGWRVDWDDLSVLSVPDRSWMARRCDGREIDPDADALSAALIAAAAGPAVDHQRCVPVLPPGDDFPRPLAALGAGAERSIVLVRETMDVDAQTLYDVAASRDGGKTWALQPGPADLRSHSLAEVATDRVGGTADLLFRTHHDDGTDALMLLQVDGAHPLDVPAPVEVGRFDLASACRRDGATWWIGDDGHVRRAHGDVVTEVAGDAVTPGEQPPRIDDCTVDAALVVDGSGMRRCAADGCTAEFPAPVDGVGALTSGGAVRVSVDGRVLSLWHPGSPHPSRFEVEQPVELGGVVVWDDVPYALVADGGAPAVVELRP